MLDNQVAKAFRDKGCIVTGAASGIGFAVSEALLQSGAAVFMADVNEKGLARAAEKLAAYGARAHTMTVDASKEGQVKRLIESADAQHGRLDFVFNNAGVGWGGAFEDATMETWRRLLDINLWSVIYGVHYAVPIMKRQGDGHIVNTSSIGGLVPLPFESLYNTAKYAIMGLSQTLHFELADAGVRVTAVCPGPVATAIFGIEQTRALKEVPNAVTPSEAAAVILAGVARNDAIIVFPENTKTVWRKYRSAPETMESYFLDFARERRRRGVIWSPDAAFDEAHGIAPSKQPAA